MRQDRLEQALLAADAAGDEESLQAIALELRQLRATEQYAPTEPQGPSSLQAGLIGAGRVFDKTISGVQDLAYRATGDDEALARLRAEQAGNDRAYAQLQETNPVATAVGEIGAYIPSAMVPGGLKTQMAVAGGMGATQYQENPWQRITSGVEDALLAGVGEKFFDGVNMLRNVWKGGGPQVPRLQSRADELGYKLTPGERLQSETLQKVEAGLESMPIVGAPVRRAKLERQGVVERAAAEAVGEPTLRNDGIQTAAPLKWMTPSLMPLGQWKKSPSVMCWAGVIRPPLLIQSLSGYQAVLLVAMNCKPCEPVYKPQQLKRRVMTQAHRRMWTA